MLGRREALGALGSFTMLATLSALTSLGAAACGGSSPRPSTPPRETPAAPLHTASAVDLFAAAGLVWLVDARLREIFAAPDLLPALDLVLPAASLDRWAAAHGGVDLRQAPELAVASYGDALLVVARGAIDPSRVERAFEDRVESLDGRATDRATTADGRAMEPITRMWGTARGAREQLAIFGRDAVALERGRFGPLRASEAFAQRRLKRAKPALVSEPLARASELLDAAAAPFRAFAAGPFEGEWARGLGGLLESATAAAVSVSPRPNGGPRAPLDCTLILVGAFGAHASLAAERLAAEVDRIARDPLGKLLGLAAPFSRARTRHDADFVALDATLDGLELARGLRAATDAPMTEILAY